MRVETSDCAPDEDLCNQLEEITRELYQARLLTSTGGNLSTRSRESEMIWITPSHAHKGNLDQNMMVCIDYDGNKKDSTLLQPSSEKHVHTEIYKAYPEIKAIIHAHAPYSTSLVLSGLPFLPISTEAVLVDELPRIPYILPGTMELAHAVVEAMIPQKNTSFKRGWNPAILMHNHGIVVSATNLRLAANLLGIIERTSFLIITCYSIGQLPPALPDEVIREIRKADYWMA